MIDKLILGRYIPRDSYVHRMDARAKLLLSIAYIAIIFLAANWVGYLVMAIFTVGVITLTNIPLKVYIKGVKPLIWLISFTVVLQMLFSTTGVVWLHFGPINITNDGVINGVYVFVRFVLIIMMSTILTLTTQPLAVADAIEYLLMPLRKVKFPVYEIALMLSIALRFVPTLMDETEKIMNAQRARGVDFANGNVFQRMKAVVPLLIPLFTSSMKRAIELGDAMEARGYRGGEGRTKYRILKWHMRDTLAVLAYVVLLAVLIVVKYYLPFNI